MKSNKQPPLWAQNLVIDAVYYLSQKGYHPDIPDIIWKNAHQTYYDWDPEKKRCIGSRSARKHSSGSCYPNYISIRAGNYRTDCKLVILHELSHWVLPVYRNGFIWTHKGHTSEFWDIAWDLYRWARLPIKYCKYRESGYRKGSIKGYKRNLHSR